MVTLDITVTGDGEAPFLAANGLAAGNHALTYTNSDLMWFTATHVRIGTNTYTVGMPSQAGANSFTITNVRSAARPRNLR